MDWKRKSNYCDVADAYLWYDQKAHRDWGAIWLSGAIFQFSEATLMAPDAIFCNILQLQNILIYLVPVAGKIYFLSRFHVLSGTENSRRVTESRPVCVSLDTV